MGPQCPLVGTEVEEFPKPFKPRQPVDLPLLRPSLILQLAEAQ